MSLEDLCLTKELKSKLIFLPRCMRFLQKSLAGPVLFLCVFPFYEAVRRVYAKYFTAFLKIFIPSPSSGSGSPLRLSSSLMRAQYG